MNIIPILLEQQAQPMEQMTASITKMVAIAAVAVVVIKMLPMLFDAVFSKVPNEKKEKEIKYFPYKKTLLLSKNEWSFYKEIKPICDAHNLHILSKVRFADLVEVDKTKINSKDYMKFFNKINKKHIDFVLCNPDNLKVIALVELDDKSHNQLDRMKRDDFVDAVCETTGYKLIRLNSAGAFLSELQKAEIIRVDTQPQENP